MGSRSWQRMVGVLAVVGSTFGTISLPAQALPIEKITEMLKPVTFFMLSSEGKGPLLAPAEDGTGVGTAGFFVTAKDAEAFLKKLSVENAELAKTVDVRPVSLATIYRLSQLSKRSSDAMKVAIIPSQDQVDSAVSLLLLHGQKVRKFFGTPVFLARLVADNSYLTVEHDKKTVIPAFFTKEELFEIIKKYRKERPEQAASLDVQVFSLEEMLVGLPLTTNQLYESIALVPAKESIEYLKKLAESLPPETQSPAVAPQLQTPAPQAPVAAPVQPAPKPSAKPDDNQNPLPPGL
jgi:Tic22-like family